MLYLRFLFKYAEYKISVEIKGSEVQSDEQKKNCLCDVSPGHASRNAAFCQGYTPRCRERCRSLKISCEANKIAN